MVNALPVAPTLPVSEERFCDEMARHNDPVLAVRNGFGMPALSKREADRISGALMARDDVKARIAEIGVAARALTGVNFASVMTYLWDVATADPNEIVQFRRVCCRYCYGAAFQYQWTEGEFWAATAAAIDAQKPAPEELGGFGFDATRGPHPACPECHGEGVGHVHVNDTRNLSHRGKLLLQSIKMGKHGPEVTLNSRVDAVTQIAKIMGMYHDRVNPEDLVRQSRGTNEIDVTTMSQEALVGMFREIVARG